MAYCLLLVPCAPMSIVCPLPSCYLIIVSVAPPVSPSLPTFVSLFSFLMSAVLCGFIVLHVFLIECVMFDCAPVFCLPGQCLPWPTWSHDKNVPMGTLSPDAKYVTICTYPCRFQQKLTLEAVKQWSFVNVFEKNCITSWLTWLNEVVW